LETRSDGGNGTLMLPADHPREAATDLIEKSVNSHTRDMFCPSSRFILLDSPPPTVAVLKLVSAETKKTTPPLQFKLHCSAVRQRLSCYLSTCHSTCHSGWSAQHPPPQDFHTKRSQVHVSTFTHLAKAPSHAVHTLYEGWTSTFCMHKLKRVLHAGAMHAA